MSDTPIDWKATLSEDLRAKPIVAQSDSLESLVGQIVGMESKLGRSLTIPGSDATADEHTAFLGKVKDRVPGLTTLDDRVDVMQKLGWPESKEGYAVDPDKEYSFDVDALKDKAYSLAMTQEQFYALADQTEAALVGQKSASDEALSADRQAIFDEWGAAKPDKLSDIKAYADLMGFDIDTGSLTSQQLRAFDKAAASTAGESIQAAKDKSSGAGVYTPQEAAGARTELMNKPAFRDPLSPEYAGLQNRFMQLTDMIAGRKPREYYLQR